jgi:Na+/H+-dicarboxylate symporter
VATWQLQLRPLKGLSSALQRLVTTYLWLQVLVGLALGVVTGLLLGPDAGWVAPQTAATVSNWLALPGHLFLALIQMIVVPLVVASIIRGLSSATDPQQLKRLGLYGGGFFLITTALASALGVGICQLLKPGLSIDAALVHNALGSAPAVAPAESLPTLTDLPQTLIGLLPNNPVAAVAAGDMLGIIVAAVIFGIALMSIPADKALPLFALLAGIQEVCMTVVGWAMRLAPLAVFGLTARLASLIGFELLTGMAYYMLTVLLGLLVLALGYLALARLLGGRRPGAFLVALRDVLLLAFSTSSSAAVMPLTLKATEEKLHVRPVVARFMIPLGATVNMGGTALYQGAATAFLAQLFGIALEPTAILLVVALAVTASIGTPGTPGVSIAILSLILNNVGIPPSGIALLLGVDRLLDMSRTAVNVMGDATACVVLDHWLYRREPPTASPEPATTP